MIGSGKKFHVTAKGPALCKAHIRECPVGGAHFDPPEDAQAAFELQMASKHGKFKGFSKRKSPRETIHHFRSKEPHGSRTTSYTAPANL